MTTPAAVRSMSQRQLRIASRTVRLVPDRAPGVAESALPAEYQRILAAVRQAAAPVAVRQIGEVLGLDTEVRGKPEPLRGKLTKPADRGYPPITRPGTPKPTHTKAITSNFTMHGGGCRSGRRR
ncbi:hypothetical protein [Streptomyces sp. NPDC001250]|uniref:hypothetical protein n=1 Tax=unclassified Streptomyces TaxID=2593676 RepID=UPI0033244D46